MGADLYIKKLSPTYGAFEVSSRAVNSGYFRDCYNSYGLFARLSANTDISFSWWKTANRKELFLKNGNMSVKGANIFLSEIKEAKKKLDLDNLRHREINGYKDNGEPVYKYEPMNEAEKKDFLEHLDLFIEFLELAIKEKSSIEWSV